ncbi:MAG: cyclase family protein [Planctomycetota bacterium]
MTNASTVRRGLLVGAGYFSEFHLDAWSRLDGAEIACICDVDDSKANAAAAKYAVPSTSTDLAATLQSGDFDFVDLATPPTGRLELIQLIAEQGLPILCQKPLANDFATVLEIERVVRESGLTFMVHENFRFQPWYREIKRILNRGVVGQKLHTIEMRSRMGDGWGDDAYLARQPYFRTMERLLVHETGIHFVDTFRYLGGEIRSCAADLRRLNDVIVGEDTGHIQFEFTGGGRAIWDANRYNESLAENPRYTFGDLLVECDGGSLWLNHEGAITIKPLGEAPFEFVYERPQRGFAGDCVLACLQHFLDTLDGNTDCETSLAQYLSSLRVVEAIYESDRTKRRVFLNGSPERRIIDLSLPVSGEMPGVEISTAKTVERDGWNATTLTLYSHAGTHTDASSHFLTDGKSLDQLDLSAWCGPAKVVNLAPIEPRQRITVEDILSRVGHVASGDRLLLRTDWHQRYGTPEYRDELPRISVELARWLGETGVALLGVEPPSVADVNNLEEVTEVHQILFRGGVRIVEGLAHLDELTQPLVDFVALPLRIVGGDGCPVRAIAMEDGW